MGAEVGGDGEVAVERRRAQLALERSQIRRLPPNKRECLLSQIVSPFWQRSLICRLPYVSSGARLQASRCQLSTPCLPSFFFFSSQLPNHTAIATLRKQKSSSFMRTSIPLYPSLEATVYRFGGGCCVGETYSDQGSSAPRRGHRQSSGDDAAGHRVAYRSWWKSQALCNAVGKQELSVPSRDELRIRHGARVEGKGKRGKKQGPVSRSVSEVGVAVLALVKCECDERALAEKKNQTGTGTALGNGESGIGNGDYI